MTASPQDAADWYEDEEPGNQHESWDDFWAEVTRQEKPLTETIRGVAVTVPHDLPLRFQRKLAAIEDASSDDVYKELVADLFGSDVLDAWIDAGMTGTEFQVVLAWGLSHGRGKPVTFREAYELVRGASGKAGARKRSPRTSTGSAATGGRSKRTSTASTASRPKASRT